MIDNNSINPDSLTKPLSCQNNSKSANPLTKQFTYYNRHTLCSLYFKENSIDYSKGKNEDNSSTQLLKSLPLNKNYTQEPKSTFFHHKTLSVTQFKRLKTPLRVKSDNRYPLEWAESLYQLEDNTPYGRTLLKIQYLDYVIIALSFLSLLFIIIDTELYIKESMHYLDQIPNATKEKEKFEKIGIKDYLFLKERQLTTTENIIRSLNGIISIVLFFVIVIQYQYMVQTLRIEKKLSQYDGIISGGLLTKVIFKSILGLLFFPPYIHIIFHFNEGDSSSIISLNCIFNAFSLSKLYFVATIINYSCQWNTKVSKAICKNYEVKLGIRVSIKSELKRNPFFTLSTFSIVNLSILGALLRSYEYGSVNLSKGLMGKKGVNDLRNYVNNIWLLTNTITAVGFGDYAPRTTTGRFLIISSSIIGVLVMCLIIVNLSKFTELSPEEKRAYLKLEKLKGKENKEHKAGNVIALIFRMKKAFIIKKNRKTIEKIHEIFCLSSLLITHIKLMKDDYVVSNCFATPINDTLQSMENKVSQNIDLFNDVIDLMNNIESDILSIEDNEIEIMHSLSNIHQMQNDIKTELFNQFNLFYIHRKRKRIKKKKSSLKKKYLKSSPQIKRIKTSKTKFLETPKTQRYTNEGISKRKEYKKIFSSHLIEFN